MGEDQAAQVRNLDGEAGRFCSMSGQPNRISGGLARLVFPVSFDGSDFRRLMLERIEAVESPMTACIGATISAIHMAIESMVRSAGLAPRSRCQAADAPTKNAVATNAAMAMCARR